MARCKYKDFNYHYLRDMLEKKEGISLSVSSVRRILKEADIISSGIRRDSRKNGREGTLVYLAVKKRRWFNDSRNFYLIIMLDDETGEISEALFTEGNVDDGYLDITYSLVSEKGIPEKVSCLDSEAFYDSRGELTIQEQLAGETRKRTHFAKALDALDIKYTVSQSSEAEERIKKVWNRLGNIINKISGQRSGNNKKITRNDWEAVASDMMEEYNKSYADISHMQSVYRTLPENINLENILCRKKTAIVLKDALVEIDGEMYRLMGFNGKTAWVREGSSVQVYMHRKGREPLAKYKGDTFMLEKKTFAYMQAK